MNPAVLDATQTFWATDSLRTALLSLADRVEVGCGEILFRQGQDVRGVFLVLAGKVRLTLRDNGVFYERTVSVGSVLGLPAVMCVKPYSLSAQADEPVSAAFVPATTVKDFLRTHPDLCFEVVEILAREVREMRHATSKVAAATV
jgi:CRP-like cAMP-binding protein